MTIQKIISFANQNLSRDNRFEVLGDAVPTSGNLNALIQAASLPSVNFHTAMWRNIGVGIKYAYDIMFNEIAITFADTSDMKIQKFYVEWMDEMYDRDIRGGGFAYRDEYVRRMTINKLDRENNTQMTYQLNDCFPINLGEVTLSQASQNTLSNLTVTFSYTDWEIT